MSTEPQVSSDANERIRQAWQAQADAWYEQRASLFADSRPIHEWMVTELDPQPGQHVLEVGAGPGETGFLVARKLGTGRLLSTDFASGMVDAARKLGASLGVTNADFRQLDAQAMDLPDASFDGVLCRWALMLMPDPAAALREARRVLRPGGRFVCAVFTGPDENPWASMPVAVLRETGILPPPEPGWQPGILALGDRARLDGLLAGAAFSAVTITHVNMTWHFEQNEDYWRFLVELTALAPLIRGLPDDQRAAFRTAIDSRLEPFRDGARVAVPARCWGIVATR
jgi:ubiquinone/menaquinone biosynthesis C-methylase UbiE